MENNGKAILDSIESLPQGFDDGDELARVQALIGCSIAALDQYSKNEDITYIQDTLTEASRKVLEVRNSLADKSNELARQLREKE